MIGGIARVYTRCRLK